MNLGIFGGTFNPPHVGHLIVAESVREQVSLDKIIFIPSYISPHKHKGEEHSAVHRLEMIKRAIKGNSHFEVSAIEVENRETSYTVKTIEYMKVQHPNDELFLLIGMDNYLLLHQWKEPNRILELATLIVMNRDKFPTKINEIIGAKNTLFVTVPNIGISSSEIRQRVAEGKSILGYVTSDVEQYIQFHSLYKQ